MRQDSSGAVSVYVREGLCFALSGFCAWPFLKAVWVYQAEYDELGSAVVYACQQEQRQSDLESLNTAITLTQKRHYPFK